MKKLVAVSLFIFWAIVTAILGAGLVFYQKAEGGLPLGAAGSVDSGGDTSLVASATDSTGQASAFVLSKQEIAKHNSGSDCWLIISGKVYNVTSYLPMHPGGPETMIPYCGKDATTAFATKDGQGSHSSSAQNMLASFYVGNLNQALATTALQQNTHSPGPAINPVNPSSVSVPSTMVNPVSQTPATQTNSGGQATVLVLSSQEVARHSSASDCWLMISGKVYNVTSYIPVHPGGQAEIIAYCGKDATVAFETQGGTGSHSPKASDMLASYYVGDLNQSVALSSVQQTPQGTSSSATQTTGKTKPPNGEDEVEEEDD